MRVVAAVLLLVSALHAGLWGVLRDKEPAPDFRSLLPSVSYAPFEGSAHPDIDNIPTVEKIRADLKTLSTMTRAIRLYSSTGGVELVPAIAAEFGLKVTVGAWIDKDKDRNEREIKAAIELARKNSNVVGVVVGNEVIYRGEQKVEDLIDMIKKVKGAVRVPVTTGEIWNIWRDNPDLASNVDFIAAHVLPYWENFRSDQAVDQAVDRYNLLRNLFPGKRIVIAEFGWPSQGYNLRNADPGPFQQALTLRNFVSRAEAIGMEYNIVEAIDQPWKFFEGGVGPYWGILNASREPKFAWTGPVENPDYWKLMTIALLVGVLLSLPILRLQQPTARQAFLLSATANGVGAWAGHRVRVLERALFHLRLGLRADARHDPACSAGADRDGTHRRDRGRRLRPAAAAAARQEQAGRERSRKLLPEGLDPHPGLLRAGRDAQADARCAVAAELPELRMRGHHQQHAGSRLLAADPGPLPRAWRTLQVHQRREGAGLQGRRAAHRDGPHRRRCRDHRHPRCRLCRRSRLAEGPRAGFRRPARRPRAGAAGTSRRRPVDHALHHERRICRLLRHRHGPAQRGQRHHRARHDVPDPPRRDGHGRRLVKRHDLRG
ncbi:hypothetical protein BRDID11002_43950 [Bradyrhizobium diazoefficiens]